MKIFQATVSTALAVANAATTQPFIPAGLAAMAIAGAAGALSVGTILSTPLPQKAARGMLLHGNSHAAGGKLIEAEGGEAIINKRSVSMFGPLLSAINEAGGGIPFTTPMSDGGFSARRAEGTSPVNLETLTSAFTDAAKEIKIYTAITDIKRADQEYLEIQQNASF